MREEFLKRRWQAYPPMPELAGRKFLCGRITQMISNEEIQVSGKTLRLNSRWRLLPASTPALGTELFSILKIGDLIAHSENDFYLLAPQVQELPLKLKAPSQELLQEFSQFLNQVRHFFTRQGFLEVGTPGLVTCPGTEPYLDVFSSEFLWQKRRQKLYLPTSPELHLKKILAMDYGPIFEIKNCFRNGEISEHHEPEFLMLEWYRPYSNLKKIAEDVAALLQEICPQAKALVRTSMRDLFRQHLQFELRPETGKEEFLKLALSLKLNARDTDTIDDLFHLIFLEKIESALPKEVPVMIKDYPPYLAAYSRLRPDGWADRFEVYWQGFELANAFHEITDPALQRQRMQEDLQKKQSLGRETFPLDEEFLRALNSGMPPSGGIALGVERLFMAVHGIKNIQELKVFPYQRL